MIAEENSPYYLGNREYPPVVLEFTCGSETITQELNWDVSGKDLTEAFVIAITHVFDEKVVLETMKNYGPEVKGRFMVDPKMIEITLSIKTGDENMTLKLGKYCDIQTLLHAFVTICVKMTFSRETAYRMINEYGEYRLEELETIKKPEELEG